MPTLTPTWTEADRTAVILSDRAASRDYLLRLLDCTGIFHQIHCAADLNGIEAILDEHAVDALFFDWQPPDPESIAELAACLDEQDDWRDIPLLVFTAETSRETAICAFLNGASDCLGYSIPAADLRARLYPHLNRKLRIDSLREENNQLARLAISDPLTGLYNRNYFDVALQFETARCQRNGSLLSLLVIVIDRFNWLHANFGYKAGDRVLGLVGGVIGDVVRRSDIPCRFNHQDFAVIMPETTAPEAYGLAERIRDELNHRQPRHPLDRFSVTLSMGISSISGAGTFAPANLIEEAYCAVETGRRFGAGRTEIFSHNLEIFTEDGFRLDLEHPQGNA
ncbi:diguanylate cyclase (GGDEF)-like protein [Geothermobacter ehrlichii]|uniref:diguanylate cyclase n=1 Tax=Geothermobacter ehrlichii TaxID=213224 RepID=A0A5D3WI81_9BACT|nr:diguanylate cyclase [Geothermobacter ehrlichii]TYO96650.1 diguanylate cyclase (GGDEF)-like protein [Geothermobacter ehrlichii]